MEQTARGRRVKSFVDELRAVLLLPPLPAHSRKQEALCVLSEKVQCRPALRPNPLWQDEHGAGTQFTRLPRIPGGKAAGDDMLEGDAGAAASILDAPSSPTTPSPGRRTPALSDADLHALDRAMTRLGMQDKAEGRRIAEWIRSQQLAGASSNSALPPSPPLGAVDAGEGGARGRGDMPLHTTDAVGHMRPRPEERRLEVDADTLDSGLGSGSGAHSSHVTLLSQVTPSLPGIRAWLPRTLPLSLPGVYPRGQLLNTLLDCATGPGIDRVPIVFVRGATGSGKTGFAALLLRQLVQRQAMGKEGKGLQGNGLQEGVSPTPRSPDALLVASLFWPAHSGASTRNDSSKYSVWPAGDNGDGAETIGAAQTSASVQRELVAVLEAVMRQSAAGEDLGLAAVTPLAVGGQEHGGTRQLGAELTSAVERILAAGRSLLLVLDGLSAPAASRVGIAVLAAHKRFLSTALRPRGGGMRDSPRAGGWAGQARVQCIMTGAIVPPDLLHHQGMLVASHTLPPLCRAERLAIAELWQHQLQQLHPPATPPPPQGLDDTPLPGAVASGKLALGPMASPQPRSGTRGRADGGEGATALEIVLQVLAKVLGSLSATVPLRKSFSPPPPGQEEHVRWMWTRVLDLAHAKVGATRMVALSEALGGGGCGVARPLSGQTVKDAKMLWPLLWFQPDACEGGEQGEELDCEDGSDEDGCVRIPRHEAPSTSTGSSSGSGEEDGCDEAKRQEAKGRLQCDHPLLRTILVQRYAANSRSHASTKPAGQHGHDDGWHVRVLADGHGVGAQGSSIARMASKRPECAHLGEASARRVEMGWDAPTSLEACRRMAGSLSSALVDTCSLDLVMALASEVIAAVLSPVGICDGGSWVHDVGGFEHTVLHGAKGRWSQAAAHARRAAANLPWVKRESVRKSAKSKVLKAVKRLKGLTALLSVGKGGKLRGLAALAALTQPSASAATAKSSSAAKKGSAHAQARNRDRAAVWAAGEEALAAEIARDLLSWKGKVALEALLLALAAGIGTTQRGHENDGDHVRARAVLAGALCAILGAQLSVIGAGVGLKAALLRNALWRTLLSHLPTGVQGHMEQLVAQLPSDVRPPIPWHAPAQSLPPPPGQGSVAAQKETVGLERTTDALICATDALISSIYSGDEKSVEAMLAAGADPVAVSSMWGTSALHVACSHALSPLTLQSGFSSETFLKKAIARKQVSPAVLPAPWRLTCKLCSPSSRADVGQRTIGATPRSFIGAGERCVSLRIVRLLIHMVPSQDSLHPPTREGCVSSSTQGVAGAGKIDGLNGGGLGASCLVAAHLWRRVLRVHRRRSRVSLGRTCRDPWHAARTCPHPCNAHDASSLLETGALEELLRDVKVERAQHLLWLLAAAGADLCRGGARGGSTRGGNATSSAAQVLKNVMGLVCDVGELSAISAGKAPPGRNATEVQATGGKEVAACLEWRELWAVACVPGDVMGADVMGRSPLHSAALAGNAGALQVLLGAGANLAAADWLGWTALHVAAYHGHTRCVDVLLSFAGALDDNAHRSKRSDMAEPRHTLEQDRQVVGAPFMQSAQSARKLAQQVDGMGRSPLHVWSYLKHKRSEGGTHGGVSRAFKLLVLASRCTFSHELDCGWTQLHACAANGSSDDWLYMAQSLADADVTLPERSSQGRSPVAVAAATGNTAIVETFVRRRMGPLDLTDARARTLLDLVCLHSLPLAADCLELLWHAVSVLGRWPLGASVPLVNLIHSLANQSREEKKASSAPALDQVLADESLLSIASASGDVATVKRLLDLRASPDSVFRQARQPSEHQGVSVGHVRGKRGRDGGLALVSHKEPLVVACRKGHEELVRLLVQRGGARVDVLSTSCGLDAYARRCVEEGSSRRAMWCERMLWTGGRETPVVTCLRHRYFDLALLLLRGEADCDVGWVRDPAAGLNHQDFTTTKMSALMVLMLLAPCRDASSACLPSVVCRVWEQIADAMVIHGLVTDDAVLQEGLRFVDDAAGGKHLTELGLSVVAKVWSAGRLGRWMPGRGRGMPGRGRGMPHADPPTRPSSRQVVVDLLSLVCARGYSECAAGLIKGLSSSSVASLRAAGRLEQPLRIAMHTGDTLIIRLLLSRVCPVIPARSPQSTGICLIDMAASSAWVCGSVARHAEEVWQHSVLLDALQAGRWEAIVELVEYLAKLLSMSESESGARNLAFGGHEAAGHHASSIHPSSSMIHAFSPAAALDDGGRGVGDVGARGAPDVGLEHRPAQSAPAARFTGPRREEMFGLWVKEGLVSPRLMPLGIHTDALKLERACAPIYSLLDGLSPESLDVRSGAVRGGAQEQTGQHYVHERTDVVQGWRFDSGSLRRFDADSSLGHRPMYEHGGGLDANSQRILNAMQHVVDMRGMEHHDTRIETKKVQTSAGTDKLQSADANLFASALDSSTDDKEDEEEQQQEEEAKAGARGSRRSRIGEMRKHGVARAKEAQTPLAVKRSEEARHHSLVHHQRQLVRCFAQREGLQVPLGVRILLLRRLAQVRYELPGPPKTFVLGQTFCLGTNLPPQGFCAFQALDQMC